MSEPSPAPGDPAWRTEADSLGEVQVPAAALYGAQTQRAVQNFAISGQPMPRRFITALLQVKKAAAQANLQLGLLPPDLGQAVVQACQLLLEDDDLMQHFPVDVFQTGSGTSSNMNANEVIATLAGRGLGRAVHPNDHVNCSQSSNDVVPSALHLGAVLALRQELLPALEHLADRIADKAAQLRGIVKTGRTHLMDAMPVRMDQVLQGWEQQVCDNIERLQAMLPQLQRLAQGGTAVGSGVNAPPGFVPRFYAELSAQTGTAFEPATSFFAQMGAQDTAVALSGQLKTVAVSVMKIANDLRWMNSGPLAGLGEIELEALQPGSSIMPGKVNPVIPEAAAMVAAQVIGNDAAVTVAGQSGQFELNVMLPLLVRNLLESIELLARASRSLADLAIAGFRVHEDRLRETLARNPMLATALSPIVGYMTAAQIAKQAYAQGRPVIDVAEELSGLDREQLAQLLDPHRLAR